MKPIVITPEIRAQVEAMIVSAAAAVPGGDIAKLVAHHLLSDIVATVNGQPVSVHAQTVEIVDERPLV